MSQIRFTTNYKRSKAALTFMFWVLFVFFKTACFDNIVVRKPLGLQFHNSIVGVKKEKEKAL